MIIKHKNKAFSIDIAYFEFINTVPYSYNTKRKYNAIYKKYIISHINRNALFINIEYKNIQNLLNSMTEIASNDTIKRCFYIWKQMYKYAIINDIVYIDETLKVTLPKSNLIIRPKQNGCKIL